MDQPLPSQTHSRALSGARILAVDDDPMFLTLVGETLENLGCDVETRSNSRSALTAFLDVDPDLVILDMRMPGLSGLDLLREIRKRSDVPILFLSSCASEKDVANALRLGADDYVQKPFRLLEFEARVAALLNRPSKLVRMH
jgi:DNA-binding response OmpR family regulator